MTVRECYDSFGGDYSGVMGRLMKEERIIKYAKMFCAGDDCAQISQALKEERYEDAFRSVHNLKGMSLNLGLTPISTTSSDLCEAVRHGKPSEDPTSLLNAMVDAWNSVTTALKQLF